MEQNNKFTISGATIKGNTLLPSERSAAVNNAGQFTGEQTLYTPSKEALHMHIHCTSHRFAGEEGDYGDYFDALTNVNSSNDALGSESHGS